MLSVLVIPPSKQGEHEWFREFLKKEEGKRGIEGKACGKIIAAYRKCLELDVRTMELDYSQIEIMGYTPKEVICLDKLLTDYNEQNGWDYIYKIVKFSQVNENKLIVVLLCTGPALFMDV